MPFDPREWIEFCGRQLVAGLTANDALRRLTNNPNLIGAYAESSIREFVRRFVTPLKLSTGAIVYESNAGGNVCQLDAIIWHPCPLPPILEAGEFAMIPRAAGLAYLEIKRSNYTDVGKAIDSCLNLEDELVPVWHGAEPDKPPIARTLGVICLYTSGGSDKILDDLVRRKRVALILSREDDRSEFAPNTEGIVLLANFLMNIRYRAALLDGRIVLNLPPLTKQALRVSADNVIPFETSSSSATPPNVIVDEVTPTPSGVQPK